MNRSYYDPQKPTVKTQAQLRDEFYAREAKRKRRARVKEARHKRKARLEAIEEKRRNQ